MALGERHTTTVSSLDNSANFSAYDNVFRAAFYVTLYELSLLLVERTQGDYLISFLNSLEKNSSVIVLGSGFGRDVLTLLNYGHRVIAVDFSHSLLNFLNLIAQNNSSLLTHPTDLTNKSDCQKLVDFLKSELAHLSSSDCKENQSLNFLAESVFQHLPKEQVFWLLSQLIPLLGDKGKFSFRLKSQSSSNMDEIEEIQKKTPTTYGISQGDEEHGDTVVRTFELWTIDELCRLQRRLIEFFPEISVEILSDSTEHVEVSQETPDFIAFSISSQIKPVI